MSLRISDRNESCTYLVDISPVSCCWPKFKHELFFLLRNGPVKNDKKLFYCLYLLLIGLNSKSFGSVKTVFFFSEHGNLVNIRRQIIR